MMRDTPLKERVTHPGGLIRDTPWRLERGHTLEWNEGHTLEEGRGHTLEG